jgi:uncharacterized DUF497 family protein
MSVPNITTLIWDRDDDPEGNVQHIAAHGLTQSDVEDALENSTGTCISRSSGRPIVFGNTRTGRHIIVVFEEIDSTIAYPITA